MWYFFGMIPKLFQFSFFVSALVVITDFFKKSDLCGFNLFFIFFYLFSKISAWLYYSDCCSALLCQKCYDELAVFKLQRIKQTDRQTDRERHTHSHIHTHLERKWERRSREAQKEISCFAKKIFGIIFAVAYSSFLHSFILLYTVSIHIPDN